MARADLYLYFNFRSPYCYLASKTMFDVFDRFAVDIVWRPFGGWNGRSDPERAKKKLPLTRQDVARWARRINIPFQPPPVTTDPTRAGAGSFLAEQEGCLRDYITAVMHAEWGEGRDIGALDVLRDVAGRIGLDPEALAHAADDSALHGKLEANWREADQRGVFGVPTFIIDDQVFWGQDRLDFVAGYLSERGLALDKAAR